MNDEIKHIILSAASSKFVYNSVNKELTFEGTLIKNYQNLGFIIGLLITLEKTYLCKVETSWAKSLFLNISPIGVNSCIKHKNAILYMKKGQI